MCNVVNNDDTFHIENWEEFLKISKIHFEENWSKRITDDVSLKDFIIKQTIGSGSFARVVLARCKKNDKCYAIKILYKRHILKMKQVEHTLNEKRFLQSIFFPFLVNMEMFFKDTCYLYFVMPFIAGGDMYTYLRRFGKCSESITIFYSSQIILALEFLHSLNVAYRDLKPENILIDKYGYLKLTDLGFCKILVSGRAYSLCGTPEYLAPEMLLSKGYGLAVDWWALGVLIYEMCAGFPPFYASQHIKIYEQIVTGKYHLLPTFSEDLKNLLFNLLQTQEFMRYGNLRNGVNDIKNHNWFKKVVWLDILNKRVKAPFIPRISCQEDTSNFDKYEDESFDMASGEWYPDEFQDF